MALTRRQTAGILAVASALFLARLLPGAGTLLRDPDEAHYCAAGARLAADGGPLYANVLVSKGPVTYWLVAAVYRAAGVYRMVPLRLVAMAWWLAAGWAVYLAGRAFAGRAAASAGAVAFLLAALHPHFHSVRADALVPLPMAVAVCLCLHGNRRGGLAPWLGGGAAVGAAFLTKQQAALLVPVLALFPLLAWWWRRDRQAAAQDGPTLGLALCQAGLVGAGFALAVGVVWLSYAVRGAGHEFVYCLWWYNWLFLEGQPSGGLLPSAGFLARRGLRYFWSEPLLGMGLVGAVAGLSWPGLPSRRCRRAPWRAQVAGLTACFVAAWLAASPADIPATTPFAYVAYVSQLYVPMCLLLAVAVETALKAAATRRLLAAGVVGVVPAYA
ncbi:MAG: glycosyltransferase family 39 protein, partial [Planctomycetota bacterium]